MKRFRCAASGIMALLTLTTGNAVFSQTWGGYGIHSPFGYKRQPPNMSQPLLVRPAPDYVIPDNNGGDVSVRFEWRAQSTRQHFGQPQITYDLCVYDRVRCGLQSNGIQLGGKAGLKSSMTLRLPSSSLQGRSFYWAVRACGPVRTPWGSTQSCAWSAPNPISWMPAPPPLPGTPCNLTTGSDPTYSGMWHLRFDWCDVPDADRYFLCMAAEPDALAECDASDFGSQNRFQTSESGTHYIRMGSPPPSTGGPGGTVHWKVIACEDDAGVYRCGNWSTVEQSTWPAN